MKTPPRTGAAVSSPSRHGRSVSAASRTGCSCGSIPRCYAGVCDTGWPCCCSHSLHSQGDSGSWFLPVTFFPPSEERLLIADVELPAGTALGKTSEKLHPFEDFLQQDESIKSYQVSIGGEDTQDPESPVRPGNKAQAFINVRESADVRKTLDRVDKEGDELYGENFQIQILQNGPPQGGLEAVLTGGSKEELA